MYMIYTIKEIERIQFSGIDLTLHDKITEIINKLSLEISSPEYNIAPQFKKNDKWLKNRVPKKNITKNEFEICLDNIRTSLNKITEKTFSTQVDKINNNILIILNAPDYSTLDNLDMINNMIYDIITNTGFFSNLYTKLYKTLLDNHNFINYYFSNKLGPILSIFDNIQTCTPDEYDLFCNINKNNEKRRSLLTFFINMMKLNCINIDIIENLRTHIQNAIIKNLSLDNSTHIVDELAILLFILVTNYVSHINDTNLINLKSYLDNFISLDKKMYPSLSNKSKFKHMDINDFISNCNKDT